MAEILNLRRPPLASSTPGASGGRLRRLAEATPMLLWTTDHDLRFTSCPPALEGGPRPGASIVDFYGAEDWDAPPVQAHRRALAGEPAEFEHRWQGRLLRCHVEPLRDPLGQVTGTVGVALDLTERLLAEEELYRESELAEVTLASIGDGVIRTDADGTVDYVNPVAERLTGWSSVEAVGKPVAEVFSLFDEMTRRPLDGPVERCLEENRVVESPGHALLVRSDGMEFSVRDSAAPIRDGDGRLVGSVLVFKDVTQLRGLEREMIYLASHDALTGLINRREFESRLKRALRSARNQRRIHALLYLDLDEFKVVNDTCGHLAGDELLKQITALLRSRVRRIDTLARLGGDEFGVLLEDCPLTQARQIAEELRGTVREFRFRWKDQIFEIGVSIGLVPINATSGDLANLLSAADAACYVAKEKGRNRVHEYEADDTLVAERYGEMQWIHRIHRAFEDRLFRLYYQPIQPIGAKAFAPGSGQSLGVPSGARQRDGLLGAKASAPGSGHGPGGGPEILCEVLIRMLDDRGRVLSPAAFISAAERYHLIGTVDRWVVRTALRALAEAQRRDCSKRLLFAINLSGQSLSDDSFLDYVVGQLVESGVDSRRICFEITETAAISKLDGATRFIKVLKEMGCRFVLDDFGSGLSSFAYLRDLPVDFLKIDGEFVKNMVEDPVKRALVESINQIGHVIGVLTIAEWVENRATLDALKQIGVDYAQGYWIAKPQPLVHEL
ncbi:MAG TPA: EAL domain-containing protein [Thermoanaerobaculia bacterium]|nr:EAL domain-containing protein [Thermoanaerobaculia bacterium]